MTQLRHAKPEHVKRILGLDAASRYVDEDFGVTMTHPWGLSEELVLAYCRDREGGYRSLVVEEDGSFFFAPPVVGAFAYEIVEDGYDVKYVVLDPLSPKEDVLADVWWHLHSKASVSKSRRRVSLVVPDHEDADVRTHLAFWQGRGFSVRLSPGHFGDVDGWACEWKKVEKPLLY